MTEQETPRQERERSREGVARALGAANVVGPLCDECPPVTSAMVHAAASVGIEHGRTTGEELALYMASQHAKHAGEVSGD